MNNLEPTAAAYPGFKDRTSWYMGLSAYWFATSFKWFILLLVVLPGQVEKLVPGGEKSSAWGMVFAIGAGWAMVGPSLFGYLTDRLGGRGARKPFIAIGSALTVMALMFLAGANQLWVIVVGYLLLQVSDDVGTGPYSALIPELVPEERRGRASGMMAIFTLVAQLSVGLLALALGGDVLKIYVSIAVVNVLCALVVLYTVRDVASPIKPSHAEPHGRSILTRTIDAIVSTVALALVPCFVGLAYLAINGRPQWIASVLVLLALVPLALYVVRVKGSFLSQFVQGWIEPWKNRDFFWVWFTRFLNAFGFYLVVNYLRYYLDDTLTSFTLFGQDLGSAGNATNVLAMAISLFGAGGALFAGKAADPIGRKRIIYFAGTLMAAAVIPAALIHDFTAIFCFATIFGVGYGMYLSADWALVSDVLPNKETAGKDMGVWQMSNSAVQIFTGLAGSLVAMGNRSSPGQGYTIAFMVASASFFLSTVLIRQVKGST